jgi:hypothetical protein
MKLTPAAREFLARYRTFQQGLEAAAPSHFTRAFGPRSSKKRR